MADNSKKPPPAAPTLSLYDDLLGANSGVSISGAPVMYKTEQDDVKARLAKIQQSLNAARPQPKRPQQTTNKGFRPKLPSTSSIPSVDTSSSVGLKTSSPTKKSGETENAGLGSSSKGGIQDWVGDDDWYTGSKRERGGRNKRKKQKRAKEIEDHNWNGIYDPSRPTNYEAYKNSEERNRELEDWMEMLRGHRRRRDASYTSSRSASPYPDRPRNPSFAPLSMSFAPPASYDDNDSSTVPRDYPSDSAGEDAVAQRTVSSGEAAPVQFVAPKSSTPPPPPPPPPPAEPTYAPGVVISAEPVRYTLPPPPPDLPANEQELAAAMASSSPTKEQAGASDAVDAEGEAMKSSRPGQKGFAARYMAKHGYKKGEGLGASGTGIISALSVKVEKQVQKTRFDAEGNVEKFKLPSMGKIVGGKKKKGAEEDSKMSLVVRCLHMLDGRDVDREIEEGNLIQELGQGCSENYGNIERVVVHRQCKGDSVPVLLKFTAQISALRARDALDGGEYGGNIVQAQFWDEDDFEKGVYE